MAPAETTVGVSAVEAAAPLAAALPPAAWLRGPRDPQLIELQPLIRLSLQQLAANLKYGCLLSYLTLLPPTCCYMHTTHTHTVEAECPIYSGAFKVGQFCYFSFALSCLVKAAIFHRRSFFTKQPSLANAPSRCSNFVFSSSEFAPKLNGPIAEGLKELERTNKQH